MLSKIFNKFKIYCSNKRESLPEDGERSEVLIGANGGAWTEDTHLTLHAKNFDYGLAEFIVQQFEFSSVLEFGSGLGLLAEYIVDNRNLDSYSCIEPNYIKGRYKEDKPKLFSIDIFSDDIPTEINKKHDVVISIEVAEHIPRNKHDELFDFLVSRSKKWIIFSGARIGQGGHGHIAERDYNDWKSEFTKRNCFYCEELSEKIRQACDEKNINHRVNIQVYKVQ